MNAPLFTNTEVSTSRIIYTPSAFAKDALVHLQEVGTSQAVKPHIAKRSGLNSYLFFVVLSGSGTLTCQGNSYELMTGDCVFLDCRKPYSHISSEDLWKLKWVHFYGPTMPMIYDKYTERGGRPAFHSSHGTEYATLIDAVYEIADSDSYIRDMQIAEKLTSILALLMEESWNPEFCRHSNTKKMSLYAVKEYLEQHYREKISLDELASIFFIDKYYLAKAFKEQFGFTIHNYLNQIRITRAKSLLRFSKQSMEQIGDEVGIADPNYFARTFKKIEGISPSEYRSRW